jgi:hypothetical protein
MAIHSGYANIYDKFKFLINIDKKSINTDDIVQGAKNDNNFMKRTLMKTHLHKNAYISELLCKMQQKKNNKIKVYLYFFRNQNLEETIFEC